MNFYLLTERDWMRGTDFPDTVFFTNDHVTLGDAPRCPVCNRYCEGMEWLPPYQIELEMFTNRFGDVIVGTGLDLIVDESFKIAFEKTDLTGLEIIGEAEVERIICRRKARKKLIGPIPKYYVARMKYGCAAIDHEKSGSAFEPGKKPICDYCRLGRIGAYRKIVIDESTWDGTDIFMARGIGGQITTSQRFKDWWDSCNFTNCKLIPSEEAHWFHDAGMSPEEKAYKMEHGWDAPWPPEEN